MPAPLANTDRLLYFEYMPSKPKARLHAPKTAKPSRNGNLFDKWSVVHLLTGVLMGWIMSAFVALSLMVLWEPLEILILSPLLARYNVVFGYESLRNSLSDIFFDVAGVAFGTWLLGAVAQPPLHLF